MFQLSLTTCYGREASGSGVMNRFMTARTFSVRLNTNTGEVIPLCGYFRETTKKCGGSNPANCSIYKESVCTNSSTEYIDTDFKVLENKV